MSIALYVKNALSRCGSTVTIRKVGWTEVTKAFVQPLRRRHRLYINDRAIPAGYFDNAYKLFIGNCRYRYTYGDNAIMYCRGEKYTVVTGEEFAVGDETVYYWAILSPVKKLKEDDYDVIN